MAFGAGSGGVVSGSFSFSFFYILLYNNCFMFIILI